MNYERSREEKGIILMRLMMFTVMLSSLNALMFHVVIPEISEEFNLTLAQASWLSSAYTLIYAFGTVTYGKLSDRFQLKTLLTFGLSLFAIGSLIGFISQSFWTALLGRCLQSAGAASVPAISLIIPVKYFAPEKRGSALSMTPVGVALGSALSPVISALIVSFANWRWLFLPSLLILALLPVYRKLLEHEPNTNSQKPFDWIGGFLLAVSISLLLLGVTNQEWFYLPFGLLTFFLFIVRIFTAKEPFIQPQLLRNKKYTLALSMSFMISCIGISLFFLTPIMLSEVYLLKSNWIGFAMIPAALTAAILGKKGGKLADRKGNNYLFSVASSCLLTCFILLSIFTGDLLFLIPAFLIFGHVGQSFIQIAMSNSISRTLSKEQVGVGMGFFSMANFIAQGIATGVYGMIVEQDAVSHWNPLHISHQGSLFSNIYLTLAGLHVVILLMYRLYLHPINSNYSARHSKS